MKQLLAISATVLAAAFLVAPGSATSGIVDLVTLLSGVHAARAVNPGLAPPPNDGAHDFAVGGGQHDDFGGVCSNSDQNCTDEGFSAHSGPLGENPQGEVSASSP